MDEERQIIQMLLTLIKGLMKVRDGELLSPALDKGHNMLIKVARSAGVTPPADLAALCVWLSTPCCEWGIEGVTVLFKDRLYDWYGGISLEAEEFLDIYVSPEESDQKVMAEIVAYCREKYIDNKQYQQYYSDIRSFVTNPENAIIEKYKLVSFQTTIRDSILGTLFLRLYEEFPKSKSNYRRCSHCGWTMTYAKGRWQCHSRTCNKETNTTKLENLADNVSHRLIPGIHRFTLVPGLTEQNLATRLRRYGYKVEMYPEVDKYDLRVWAGEVEVNLDVKEYNNPQHLVEYINKEYERHLAGESKFIDHCYIVIPSHLTDRRSGYLSQIKKELKGKIGRVKIIVERNVKSLLEKVRGDKSATKLSKTY